MTRRVCCCLAWAAVASLLALAGPADAAVDLTKIQFAERPEHVILYIIDGISHKTWDRTNLPTLRSLIRTGALVEQNFLPPSEHPVQGPYAEFHSCSIPNPVMMAGTLFLDANTEYFPHRLFQDRTTAFVANTTNYSSLNKDYHYSYQKLGPDHEGIAMAVAFMKMGRPAFMRLHLQEVGEASYQILFIKEDVPWRRNIWAPGSPYVDMLHQADRHLEGFLSEFEELGVLEKTALIIMGDHGEADTGYHPPESYDAAITSIILWGAGIRKGVRIPYAEQMDIVPTICSLLGTDPPSTSQGRIIGEALERSPANLPPRKMLLKTLLSQFGEFRTAKAEASYLMSKLVSPESTRLYREFGNIKMDFYGIDRFIEWPRFTRIDSLIENNGKALDLLNVFLMEVRSIKEGEE